MRDRHGSPIWYELVTPDPDGAAGFYTAVAGVQVGASMSGPVEYRVISTPGGPLGGMMRLTGEMEAGGARATWLLYVGVDDVDGTVARAEGAGGRVLIPAMDIAGVGRFALLADPQGAPFYVMRPLAEESSTVFERKTAGRVGWNELVTPDSDAALGFYSALFGWENLETMQMGPLGDYRFLTLGSVQIGAMAQMKGRPAHWNIYINVTDVDASLEAVRAGGGVVEVGPHTVPNGDRILLGLDPQGAPFALVGPGPG